MERIMVAKITVNAEGLERLRINLKKKHFSPNQVVKHFVPIAKSMAPEAQDSLGGGTKEAIGGIYSGDDKFAILRLSQPRFRSPLREYHLWMNGIGKYDTSKYIKNNKGKFMFRVAEDMADYVNREATKGFKFK